MGPGIEPRSPRPLANTLPTRPMVKSTCQQKEKTLINSYISTHPWRYSLTRKQEMLNQRFMIYSLSITFSKTCWSEKLAPRIYFEIWIFPFKYHLSWGIKWWGSRPRALLSHSFVAIMSMSTLTCLGPIYESKKIYSGQNLKSFWTNSRRGVLGINVIVLGNGNNNPSSYLRWSCLHSTSH